MPVTVKTPGTHVLQLTFTGDKNVKGAVGTYNVPFAGSSDSYLAIGTDVYEFFRGTAGHDHSEREFGCEPVYTQKEV